MNKRPVLLLMAVSARALAFAARRAGYAAVAIDAFGDEDARDSCVELLREEGAMEGFAGIALEPVVARLCAAHAPVGLVFGSGFDDCAHALAPLGAHARLYGAPGAMEAAKDPIRFATACAAAGLAHPETTLNPGAAPLPDRTGGWLVKRRGGCGGLHVGPADRALRVGDYAQVRVEGRAVSLLFVRDAFALTPIGWSEQWTAPSRAAPYRYGGAAGPLDLVAPAGLMDGLADLTGALGVRGLASADFIDDGETFWLLEINPRPGATLDVFDDEDDPLLARHIAASEGERARPRAPRTGAAAEIVYSEVDAVSPAGDWPAWALDRPAAGTRVPAGSPFCTVTARAGNAAQAKALVRERSRRMRDRLQEKRR